MSEYSNVIEGMFGTGPQTSVTANIGVDPDRTARAYELEKVTGVPASVIGGDLENFEATHKAAMASDIVTQNQAIAEYVQSHPLASQISNDDYGNLDTISGALHKTRQFLDTPRAVVGGALSGLYSGFSEGFGQGGIGSWISPEDYKNYPLAASVWSVLASPIEGAFRIGSGAMKGIAEGAAGGAEEGYKGFGGSESGARSFGRDIAAMVEMQMTPGANVTSGHPVVAQAIEAAGKAGRYIRNGEEPPPGLHPMVDQIKTQRNQLALEQLEGVVDEVQNSTTRQRAPELFQDFVKQHVSDSQIGISGARVAELYGDRTPVPGDGLLGWVPDIEAQLAVAKETGADISIPLADWITKVDPAVAKELRDDTRVVKGGITNREAVELQAQPPKPTVEETLPELRGDAGLEPLFAMGDRKLALQRVKPIVEQNEHLGKPPQQIAEELGLNWDDLSTFDREKLIDASQGTQRGKFGVDDGFHDFDLINEHGQSVGTINLSEQKGGKQLYIEMINGIGEYYNPNNFGPALMRDLIRQIKAEFPNAETLTGHRVSGARGEAGTYNLPSAMPVIKLADETGWNLVGEMDKVSELIGGAWAMVHEPTKTEAYIKPSELFTVHEAELAKAVNDELARIAPGVTPVAVSEMRKPGARTMGAFMRYPKQEPIIIWALNSDYDPIGIGRHEAIHYLKSQRFFSKNEWGILERAAEAEGWLAKHDIEGRYPTLSHTARLEEGIAEAYRTWKDEIEQRKSQPGFEPTLVDKIFQKLSDLLDSIKKKIGEILDKEPTFEDLFQMIDTGEIGQRGRNAGQALDSADRKAARQAEGISFAQDISEPGQGIDPQSPFAKAKDVGMTVEQYNRYMKLIAERQQADLKSSVERAMKEQAKRQTKEWKEQSEAMRPQVIADINARPAIAADNFFGLGELFGEKLDKTYRLDWEALTPEQRAILPERYTVRKGGVSPDEVAPIFGYKSGAEMIDALAGVVAAREASGLGRERFTRQMIQDEINRRMEAEHGFLEKNIFDDARDQVLSENQLDLLHEETTALAMMSGEKGFDLTRQQLVAQIAEKFESLPARTIASDKFMKEVGRWGKAAEMELLRGNPAEAFRAKQAQYFNTIYAEMARAFEKANAQLTRTAKPYLSGKTKAIEPVFTDHIQNLLSQAGYRIKRTPEELAHSLEFHGQANLGDFVREIGDQGWEPIVSDALQNSGAKPKDAMSVAEFREFKDAITSLNHIGREIRKIEIAGEKQDFADFKSQVINNITQLPPRPRKSQGRWLFNVDASLTRMEEMIKDLDLRQELGPLWDAVIHPMVLSKTKEFDLMQSLSNHFKETRGKFDGKWRKSLGETLPNDVIFDPYSETMFDMTRENLIQVMLNWGNRSNIEKFVNGAGFARWGRRLTKDEAAVYESQIKSYIDTHARPEDWEFVRRLWEPFEGWAKEMDTVARNTSGIAPKWVDIGEVETPHGTFRGGYWPVKYDQLGSNISVIKDRAAAGTDGIFGTDYFRAATSKGYLKSRTGYVDFVDISTSIEQAVATMQQTIHDISFRDSLIQASKVFYDKDIRAAIKKHYGEEYEAQLIPWLKRISYQFSADDRAMKGLNDFLRRARVNLVGHSLPLNLKVILSPDLGVPNPIMWANYIANRKANTELAMTHSKEIRHLVYNLDRDYREALDRITIKYGTGDVQKKAIEWGYVPVAKVSQEFRIATFVDEFYKQKSKGRTDEEAALLADSRVREQHGAASIVDLPAALSSSEAMKMLTLFQGYFNTMYNWQRQMPGQVRRGEWSNLATTAMGSIGVGAFFGATMFNQQKESDSWFKVIAKAMLLQPLSTVPILSHAANYFAEGFSPRMPFASLLNAAGNVLADAKKLYQHKPIEKPIAHGANAVGMATGLPLMQIGRTGQFAYDTAIGRQRPRNIGEWARGIITGEARLKK